MIEHLSFSQILWDSSFNWIFKDFLSSASSKVLFPAELQREICKSYSGGQLLGERISPASSTDLRMKKMTSTLRPILVATLNNVFLVHSRHPQNIFILNKSSINMTLVAKNNTKINTKFNDYTLVSCKNTKFQVNFKYYF